MLSTMFFLLLFPYLDDLFQDSIKIIIKPSQNTRKLSFAFHNNPYFMPHTLIQHSHGQFHRHAYKKIQIIIKISIKNKKSRENINQKIMKYKSNQFQAYNYSKQQFHIKFDLCLIRFIKPWSAHYKNDKQRNKYYNQLYALIDFLPHYSDLYIFTEFRKRVCQLGQIFYYFFYCEMFSQDSLHCYLCVGYLIELFLKVYTYLI